MRRFVHGNEAIFFYTETEGHRVLKIETSVQNLDTLHILHPPCSDLFIPWPYLVQLLRSLQIWNFKNSYLLAVQGLWKSAKIWGRYEANYKSTTRGVVLAGMLLGKRFAPPVQLGHTAAAAHNRAIFRLGCHVRQFKCGLQPISQALQHSFV